MATYLTRQQVDAVQRLMADHHAERVLFSAGRDRDVAVSLEGKFTCYVRIDGRCVIPRRLGSPEQLAEAGGMSTSDGLGA